MKGLNPTRSGRHLPTKRPSVYEPMVHAALARLGRAATVEEVFLEVCNRRNPIAFTTTYRTLNELVRRGLVVQHPVPRSRRLLYALAPA
ncbi:MULTISPECIES: hypothetical protein [unclassified Acidovorax]|jgi:Fe2+ or Zn2+ uptake regulation protein|uniref:hypothetical protein n=1 Tax=unclassified Acidovorax TaxID=2684926 RepID=UPI0011C01AB4|nr:MULTISPECIES: hypothetical protein [unclassified Acidovorax]HQS64615.1 hypothetical protein [Acidovorax defluvii]HQT19390.1 hypothetical protein [Acidovorax defluvii]HQT51484.1 hypothetical protein [Acidovorax defluvii]